MSDRRRLYLTPECLKRKGKRPVNMENEKKAAVENEMKRRHRWRFPFIPERRKANQATEDGRKKYPYPVISVNIRMDSIDLIMC
jgi:hypothetical protein